MNWLIQSIAMSIMNFVTNKSFLQIWNQEKDQLFPGKSYFLTYPEEYFAESFAYFYLGGQYREELKKKAP